MSRRPKVLASYPGLFQRPAGLSIGVMFAALGVVLAAIAIGPGGWALAPIVAVNLALAAYFLLWFARIGAYITSDGVRVIRMTRSIEIPWAEHPHFSVRPRELMDAVHVERAGLPPVWVDGLGGRRHWRQPSQLDVGLHVDVQEMNMELKRLHPSTW